MYRSILLPVDGSAYTEWARQLAYQLLEPSGALKFLHVVDLTALEGSFLKDLAGAIGAEPFLNLSPKLEKVLRDRGQLILQNEEAVCKERGRTCETTLEAGIVSSVIADKAIETELVIVGKHGRNEGLAAGFAGSATEALLRKSPRPVLVVAREPRESIQKVLLGFDGSTPSAHAMTEAHRICDAKQIPLKVLVVGNDSQTSQAVEDASKYFANVSYETDIEAVEGDADQVLVEHSAQYDLLVMGCHGHNRIIELVLGSTTEYVLRNVRTSTLFTR